MSKPEESTVAFGEAPSSPEATTLFTEYLRLGILGTSACAALFWMTQLGQQSNAMLMIVASLALIAVHAVRPQAFLIRLALLVPCALAVATSAARNDDWIGPFPFFSPLVLFGFLTLLALRDLGSFLSKGGQRTSGSIIVVSIATVASLIYVLVMPAIQVWSAPSVEGPAGFVVEELTYLELLKAHTGKFLVFSFFCYVGACIGSFLNVVAASAPKGESIVVRSSACPTCDTPIRRQDNWPLISYLRLGGKCRACKAPIAERYFMVEVIAASIFGSLFLYELVTGAANIPGFQHYSHAGILWIVLYTKWPVMGIYLFSCGDVLLRFDVRIDGMGRSPRRRSSFQSPPSLFFATLAIAIPTLQPVELDKFLPIAIPAAVPSVVLRAGTCPCGRTDGRALVARFQAVLLRSRIPVCLDPSRRVTRMAGHGHDCRFSGCLPTRFCTSFGAARPRWLSATPLLFLVAMLHHPAWGMLSQVWWRLSG